MKGKAVELASRRKRAWLTQCGEAYHGYVVVEAGAYFCTSRNTSVKGLSVQALTA